MKKKLLMSKVLSFITMMTLVVSMAGLKPVTAQAAAVNPTLSNSCGIDMVMVMDTSTSIGGTGMTGEIGQMKTAFDGFVDAMLPSTPASIAVVSFSDAASLKFPFSSDATLLKNGINAIDGSGYTNWESALMMARTQFTNDGKPHLIIFTSDGDPTASSAGAVNINQPNVHLAPAIAQADLAKASGIRIVTLGVGTDINVANMQAISSPDASFTTTNFVTLANDLQGLASNLCGGRITTTKIIDIDGNLATTADQSGAANWKFNVAGSIETTDLQGKTGAVDVTGTAGPLSIVETSQSGYVPLYASCVNTNHSNAPIGKNDVQGSMTNINLTDKDIVSCTFYNKPGLPPTGTLSATPCTIASGASKCDTTLKWNTINPINTSAVTTPTDITVATGNAETVGKTYPVTFGSRTFYLYNNSDNLAQAQATATCATGTSWDNTKCTTNPPTDLCPDDAGIQTTLPCPNGDLCPEDPGVQLVVPCSNGDMCSEDPGVQTNVPCSNGDYCPNVPGIQTSLPCASIDLCPNDLGVQTTTPCPSDDPNALTGTLVGSDCTIASGQSSCKTDLTLHINNPVAGKATNITKATNVEVASGITPAIKTNIVVNYPSTTFYLNHNSLTLTSQTINAICENGTAWDEATSKCKDNVIGTWSDVSWGDCSAKACGERGTQTGTRICSKAGTCVGPDTMSHSCYKSGCTGEDNFLNLIIKASPKRVMKGKPTTLSWESDEGSSCTSTQIETNGKNTGVAVVTPLVTTTYKISCMKHGLNDTKDITVTVDAIKVIEQ